MVNHSVVFNSLLSGLLPPFFLAVQCLGHIAFSSEAACISWPIQVSHTLEIFHSNARWDLSVGNSCCPSLRALANTTTLWRLSSFYGFKLSHLYVDVGKTFAWTDLAVRLISLLLQIWCMLSNAHHPNKIWNYISGVQSQFCQS